MSEPLVVCVMLVADRQEMGMRAARSFAAQTYKNSHLLIFDNGPTEFKLDFEAMEPLGATIIQHPEKLSIGELRNAANEIAKGADIICHFDSDDWSHPSRIAEQVALLQASGADCVGFSDMLFWRTVKMLRQPDDGNRMAEAWLFTGGTPNYILGTSMCYWRKAWERWPFLNESAGVEEKWCRDSGLKIVAASSVGYMTDEGPGVEQMMIASIHAGNSSSSYNLEEYVRLGSTQWKRVPEWEDFAREKMQL
jgi:glycosyltransferase involved in cell wall biosynthesis